MAYTFAKDYIGKELNGLKCWITNGKIGDHF